MSNKQQFLVDLFNLNAKLLVETNYMDSLKSDLIRVTDILLKDTEKPLLEYSKRSEYILRAVSTRKDIQTTQGHINNLNFKIKNLQILIDNIAE